MESKQELERELLKLNKEYNKKREELNHRLFELKQLENEKEAHKMKHELSFYIDIFKHLIQLEDTYCNKSDGGYNCDECKFVCGDKVCIKNWLLDEYEEFVRQAKKEL